MSCACVSKIFPTTTASSPVLSAARCNSAPLVPWFSIAVARRRWLLENRNLVSRHISLKRKVQSVFINTRQRVDRDRRLRVSLGHRPSSPTQASFKLCAGLSFVQSLLICLLGRQIQLGVVGKKYDGDSWRTCGDWHFCMLVRCHGCME